MIETIMLLISMGLLMVGCYLGYGRRTQRILAGYGRLGDIVIGTGINSAAIIVLYGTSQALEDAIIFYGVGVILLVAVITTTLILRRGDSRKLS